MSRCDVQILVADVREETIVESTHVSLGMNDTADCSLASKAEELVVIVPDVTPTTFKKVTVEVPEANPSNGSTNDVIAAERFSVECAGAIPGTVGTVLFPKAKLRLEFTYIGLSRAPTPYEKGDSPIVSKLTRTFLNG